MAIGIKALLVGPSVLARVLQKRSVVPTASGEATRKRAGKGLSYGLNQASGVSAGSQGPTVSLATPPALETDVPVSVGPPTAHSADEMASLESPDAWEATRSKALSNSAKVIFVWPFVFTCKYTHKYTCTAERHECCC